RKRGVKTFEATPRRGPYRRGIGERGAKPGGPCRSTGQKNETLGDSRTACERREPLCKRNGIGSRRLGSRCLARLGRRGLSCGPLGWDTACGEQTADPQAG